MNLITKWLLLLILGHLSACTVGPDYARPFLSFVSKKYKSSHAITFHSPAKVQAWWLYFQDPVLNAIITVALKENMDVQAAKARVAAARARVYVAKTNYVPSVNSIATYSAFQLSHEGIVSLLPNAPRTFSDKELFLGSSWELDLFGRIKRKNQVAFYNLHQKYLDELASKVTLVAAIAKEYIRLRALDARISIQQQMITILHRAWNLHKERFRVGISSGVEVTKAHALLISTKAKLPQLQLLRQELLYRVDILAGKAPGTFTSSLEKKRSLPSVPFLSHPGAPSDLLRLRPDVLSAEYSLMAANAEIGVQQAELYPKFILFADSGLEALSQNNLFTSSAISLFAGPTVSWRLLNYWQIDAAIQEAYGKRKESLANYKSIVLHALYEVEKGLVHYKNNAKILKQRHSAEKEQQKNAVLVAERFQRGLISYLNVIVARKNVLIEQEEVVLAQQNSLLAYIALSEALGGGVLVNYIK